MSDSALLEKIKAELDDWEGIEDPAPYPSRRDLAILQVRRVNNLYQKHLAEYVFWHDQMTQHEYDTDASHWRRGFVRAVHPFLCSSTELLIADAAVKQALPKDITIDPYDPIASLLETVAMHRAVYSTNAFSPLTNDDNETLRAVGPILRRALRPESTDDFEVTKADSDALVQALWIVDRAVAAVKVA